MTDSIPIVRIELLAALDVLAPEIVGLDVLTRSTMSAPMLQIINDQLAARRRRHDLITALEAALDALNADGYPELNLERLTQPQLDEITKEIAAISSVGGIFEAGATALGLDVKNAVSSPQPVPAT
jgi:hypothetical protein